MIDIDESITHPALITRNYIRADEYDPTKNTPVVIDIRLGGKRKKNKRTSKKRTYKKKIINKKKRTNSKNKRIHNSTKNNNKLK